MYLSFASSTLEVITVYDRSGVIVSLEVIEVIGLRPRSYRFARRYQRMFSSAVIFLHSCTPATPELPLSPIEDP